METIEHVDVDLDRLHRTLHLLRAEEIVDFDLSRLGIDGKQVFEMGTISRGNMPQLKGFPRKGSVAEQLPKDKNGKVDVSAEFLNYLTSVQGYTVSYARSPASELRGSQSELVASKVAKTLSKLWKNPEHKKFHQTYIVDRNCTLLDGHHGWASVRLCDVLKDIGVDTKLTVAKLDCSIEELIDAARNFTTIIGIENKEGV